MQSDR